MSGTLFWMKNNKQKKYQILDKIQENGKHLKKKMIEKIEEEKAASNCTSFRATPPNILKKKSHLLFIFTLLTF